MLYEIAPEYKVKIFEETGDVDFGYEIPGMARFRANFFNQKYGVAAVFRQIPSTILTTEQLGLPPIMKKFAELHKGLVLVTGPTGSGKSTTLAAIVDYANKTRKDHIITVEDPDRIRAQEPGLPGESSRSRTAHEIVCRPPCAAPCAKIPDIILVGEMRDLETIELALTAAATGHLVFGTLHTPSAAKTIDRVIDVFPADQQNQIRNTLSESLKGVVAQNLLKRIDVKGRVAALEILVVTPAIANLIREAKTFQIPGMLQVGKKYGMQTLDDAIMDLLNKKMISPEDAYSRCIDKTKFRPSLEESAGGMADDESRTGLHPRDDAGFAQECVGSQHHGRQTAAGGSPPVSSSRSRSSRQSRG